MVPGHEIAGVVSGVGPGVTRCKVGDRVGVGCMADSCRECENCKAGQEQHCVRGAVQACNGIGRDGEITYGGYATHVVDENFVVRIPDGLSLDVAAPLLCAGITTYAPLKQWGAGPGRKVAVVGLGGLGHVGVKIAHALGAEVTALSRPLRKKGDGLKLGADRYCATSDPKAFEELAGAFDLIVSTVSAPLDLGANLSLLKAGGAMGSRRKLDAWLRWVRFVAAMEGRPGGSGALGVHVRLHAADALLEDEVEQSGEPLVQIFLAQRVDAAGADVVLPDEAGLAQDAEVAGEYGRGDVLCEAAAGQTGGDGEGDDDGEPGLVGQRAHDLEEVEVVRVGVDEG
jgi:hypothetical protein